MGAPERPVPDDGPDGDEPLPPQDAASTTARTNDFT
jgi:hypothetical protein